MKKHSNESDVLNNLLGFSENLSIQKSYYPQLQSKIQEIEKEKQKYQNLFNNISDALIITDNDGVIKDLNKESERQFGFTRKELIGNSIFNIVGNDYQEDVHKAIIVQYSNNLEICHKTKNKTEKYSSINIQKIEFENNKALLFLCRDITEKKIYEIEINKVRKYVDDIFESMPSIIISVNDKCEITQCNRNAETWMNKKLKQIKGENLFNILPSIKIYENIIMASIQKMEVLSNIKYRETPGNLEFTYEVTVFPLQSSRNGAVVRIDDISEKINLEKMIIQSEKMLSIGGLAAGMAHEINNPLAGMIQNANVLKNRLQNQNDKNIKIAKECDIEFQNLQQYIKNRKIDKLINLIIDSGLNAAEIVRSMLNFARNNEMDKTKYNLFDLIDETIELANHDYDIHKRFDFKKIEIIRNYNLKESTITCNKSQLQQVFFNLLKNSTEALFTNETDDKKIIEINIFQHQSMIVVEFVDNGPGIPDNIIKKVFDPFFTTKGPGFGTGLGLFVSYYIIAENHNGTIDVERLYPNGTKFTIKLLSEEFPI